MARQKRILCIDDHWSGLIGRKMLLEQNGYEVLEATGGSEGLKLFLSQDVDAVILDYQMPDMNGAVVAAKMKKVVHIADIKQEEGYLKRDPFTVAGVELGGYRTALVVPILKEQELIGTITALRSTRRRTLGASSSACSTASCRCSPGCGAGMVARRNSLQQGPKKS